MYVGQEEITKRVASKVQDNGTQVEFVEIGRFDKWATVVVTCSGLSVSEIGTFEEILRTWSVTDQVRSYYGYIGGKMETGNQRSSMSPQFEGMYV
jgi:hypothetical protein